MGQGEHGCRPGLGLNVAGGHRWQVRGERGGFLVAPGEHTHSLLSALGSELEGQSIYNV